VTHSQAFELFLADLKTQRLKVIDEKYINSVPLVGGDRKAFDVWAGGCRSVRRFPFPAITALSALPAFPGE
jgi:hypothetical protein